MATYKFVLMIVSVLQARAFRGDQAKIKNRRKIQKVNKQEQVKAVKCQFMVLCSEHRSRI